VWAGTEVPELRPAADPMQAMHGGGVAILDRMARAPANVAAKVAVAPRRIARLFPKPS
jgi:hypothetical protein